MYIFPPSVHLFVVRQSAMIYFQVELSEFLCGRGGFETLRIAMAKNRWEVIKKIQFNDYFKVFILCFLFSQ
jgi:hypothetical protein